MGLPSASSVGRYSATSRNMAVRTALGGIRKKKAFCHTGAVAAAGVE